MQQLSVSIDTPNLLDLVEAGASAEFEDQNGIPLILSILEDGSPEQSPLFSFCEDGAEGQGSGSFPSLSACEDGEEPGSTF
jgi:hypothetical protein